LNDAKISRSDRPASCTSCHR